MIRISEKPKEIIKMEIIMHIPRGNLVSFLQKRGFEVKAWLWKFNDETFPNGVTSHEVWTFTATRPGEEQSEGNIYFKVFESEVKELLKDL